MASIKTLDKDSVHKICSGQVIFDLASAVKELIENALDSHATSIEIKLKESGVESIEVSDNGDGIDQENYSALALKHHTSKIQDFSDLSKVMSFGFRGEALNALCELSHKLTVITKKNNEQVGNLLEFGKNGELTSQKPTSRTKGTTVIVDKLFDVLPVRRGEMIRNVKKQYQKLLKVIQSYAVISVGTKIVVSDVNQNNKNLIIATQLSTKLEDNISSIFGSKFLSSLIPLEVEIKNDPDNGCINLDLEDSSSNEILATVKGHVSKVGAGVGRNDNDRQFLFCNGRPVDLPKVTKSLNEVWRRYEMKHKPAFILNIQVPTDSVDINLSPDKREIVLIHEQKIIDALKERLDKLYAPSRFTFKVNDPQKESVSALNFFKTNLDSHLSSQNESISEVTEINMDLSQNETTASTDTSIPFKADKVTDSERTFNEVLSVETNDNTNQTNKRNVELLKHEKHDIERKKTMRTIWVENFNKNDVEKRFEELIGQGGCGGGKTNFLYYHSY